MEEISTEQMAGYMDTAVEMAMTYGPQLILAIVVLIIGLWIINRAIRLMGAAMERSNTEPTLAKFLCNLSSVGLKALLLISVASMIGIETTSFIAVLGAAGLAIGLALQGSLANFAGGVLVLMFRPYKVGDFIDAQGVMGTVHEIQIFNTILKTPDNKVIIVPNGAISNGIITNFSMEATRRVDFVFGIGYSDDIAKAKGHHRTAGQRRQPGAERSGTADRGFRTGRQLGEHHHPGLGQCRRLLGPVLRSHRESEADLRSGRYLHPVPAARRSRHPGKRLAAKDSFDGKEKPPAWRGNRRF